MQREGMEKNLIPSLKSITMVAVAGARQKRNEFVLAEAQRHSLTSYYTTPPICCDLVLDRTVHSTLFKFRRSARNNHKR